MRIGRALTSGVRRRTGSVIACLLIDRRPPKVGDAAQRMEMAVVARVRLWIHGGVPCQKLARELLHARQPLAAAHCPGVAKH